MERTKLFPFAGFGGLVINAELYLHTNHYLEKPCFLDTLAMLLIAEVFFFYELSFCFQRMPDQLILVWKSQSDNKCLLLLVLEAFGNHLLLRVFTFFFFPGRVFCIFIVVNDLAYSLILNESHNYLYVSSCLLLKETCFKLLSAESD